MAAWSSTSKVNVISTVSMLKVIKLPITSHFRVKFYQLGDSKMVTMVKGVLKITLHFGFAICCPLPYMGEEKFLNHLQPEEEDVREDMRVNKQK